MNLTSEEAQAGLDMVRQTQNRFEKAIAAGYASHLCILWGNRSQGVNMDYGPNNDGNG